MAKATSLLEMASLWRGTEFFAKQWPRKTRNWHLNIAERRRRILETLQSGILAARKEKLYDFGRTCIRLIRHMKLLKNEPPEIRFLYVQILWELFNAGLYQKPAYFSRLITDPIFAPDNFYRQIATHNAFTGIVFQEHGIDLQQWEAYLAESVGIATQPHQARLWKQLNQDVDALLAAFPDDNLLKASLKKDCAVIRTRKKDIFQGQFKLPGTVGLNGIFPVLFKSLDYLRQKPGSKKNLTKIEFQSSLIEKFWEIESAIMTLGESKVRSFSIQFWRKDNYQDLLLGNRVNNCLSIGERKVFPAVRLPGVPGRRRPAGVLDYFVDQGVQAVEIREIVDGLQYSAGQTYLFVFLDKGEPVLMADSFELNPQHQNNKFLRLKIRDALFEFLKRYAAAIGIKRVVLGRNGPLLESGKNKGKRHWIKNDAEINDLPVAVFEKIDKLGGYWNHTPYFLESVGGTEAYVIS